MRVDAILILANNTRFLLVGDTPQRVRSPAFSHRHGGGKCVLHCLFGISLVVPVNVSGLLLSFCTKGRGCEIQRFKMDSANAGIMIPRLRWLSESTWIVSTSLLTFLLATNVTIVLWQCWLAQDAGRRASATIGKRKKRSFFVFAIGGILWALFVAFFQMLCLGYLSGQHLIDCSVKPIPKSAIDHLKRYRLEEVYGCVAIRLERTVAACNY